MTIFVVFISFSIFVIKNYIKYTNWISEEMIKPLIRFLHRNKEISF